MLLCFVVASIKFSNSSSVFNHSILHGLFHLRLSDALEKIDQFNQEEEAFGWELSTYPLRKQVSDKLAPYKKLYDNANEYLTKNRNWTLSKVGSFEPDEIENDVSNYYRAVYKLEKIFSTTPEAYRLANAVR